jgi:hypothetical protein
MRILSCAAIVALAACAPAPVKTYDVEDAKKMVADPDQLLDYLMTQLLAKEFGSAHEYGLSRDTKALLRYELFHAALTMEQSGVGRPLDLEVTRRLLRGLRQHGLHVEGASATARWCNPEFGFSHPVRLSQQKIGRKRLWGYDFTRDELEGFMRAAQDAALAWFSHQKKVADGKLYTYPPDWHHTPLGSSCRCAAAPAR